MRLKKLSVVTILLALSAVSCGSAWVSPKSWTIRSDGRIRASQRKEDFSAEEFIAKIKKEENKEFGYVLTPDGEAEISRRIRELNAEITRLKNDLRNCR